jgi:iron(III) transport system ATP-binding protein
MTAALTLDHVTKRFGPVTAVDDLSLEVGPQELVALVGPSGCGKSTLLRVVAGLLTADAGRILLGGSPVDDGDVHLPPERRGTGLVFQEHALFPHLTVAGNVAFGLRRLGRHETRARVGDVLDLVGMAGHRDRYPHELSGGERQRVALARALAPRPRLMLLDEPFASLDPNLRAQIREDVVGILRRAATPAVFVTHDQDEALGVGDRVAVMRTGRLDQVASPRDVFHRPANRFVAAFMGEASFLPVERDGEGLRIELGPVPAPAADDAARAGAVAMVRPDDVDFVTDPSGDAEITAVEFRGSVWSYTVRLASGALVRSSRAHLVSVDVGTRVRAGLVSGHQPVLIPPDR